MVFGHLAAGSLGNRFLFRRAGLSFCLVAAFGPDWIDKPLKLFFGLPGHGIAHSLIGAALFLAAFAWACRRLALPASWPWVAAFFWGLHFACDLVKPAVLFWPLLGPFPVYAGTTAEAAWNFYSSRPLSGLAWCDLALVALAAAVRPVDAWPRPAVVSDRSRP
ncbi:hypothetical protein [Solidesulfovibrio sp.]|uniref:hypothetical protein n=1 Tax=Solidesulfovibrio sp. TaxID=2910990 RepID=UPI0026106EB4|nr:hypothetical protein [Solidesulfovibrio sp.]